LSAFTSIDQIGESVGEGEDGEGALRSEREDDIGGEREKI